MVVNRNRRSVLGSMAVAAMGTTVPAAVQEALAEAESGCERNPLNVDVVVIGAGFSGLAAAERLSGRGLTVALVEAQDRIGGRSESERVDGAVLDLGAGWITDPDHNYMLDLAKRFGIKLYPQYDDGEIVHYADGRRDRLPPLRISADHYPQELDGAFAILREMDRLAGDLDITAPWTFAEAAHADAILAGSWISAKFPDLNPQSRNLVNAIFGGYPGSPDWFSLLHALFYGKNAGGWTSNVFLFRGQLRSPVGTQGLAELLWSSLDRRLVTTLLAHPVTAVASGQDQVAITTATAQIMAKRVIVAVSPMVASRIRFRTADGKPMLGPIRQHFMQRFPLYGGIKAFWVYDEPFWRRDGLNGQVSSTTEPVALTYDQTPPSGAPGVLVTLVLPEQIGLGGATADEIRTALTRSLANYFGPKALSPRAYRAKYWDEDPYILGHISYATPGCWSLYGSAWREPIGRVHWAATETASKSFAQMNGAFSAGLRAADEVIALG
jgi:monoamine oxidase